MPWHVANHTLYPYCSKLLVKNPNNPLNLYKSFFCFTVFYNGRPKRYNIQLTKSILSQKVSIPYNFWSTSKSNQLNLCKKLCFMFDCPHRDMIDYNFKLEYNAINFNNSHKKYITRFFYLLENII